MYVVFLPSFLFYVHPYKDFIPLSNFVTSVMQNVWMGFSVPLTVKLQYFLESVSYSKEVIHRNF